VKETNVELVRRAMKLHREGDDRGFLELVDPDAELRTPTGRRSVYRGLDGARSLLAESAGARSRIAVTPLHFWSTDDLVVVTARFDRPDPSTTPKQGVWLWELRDGRVLRIQPYPTIREALDAADLESPVIAALDEAEGPIEHAATVVGRWGDGQALLQLDDHHHLEAPAPAQMQGMFDVGDKAIVYLLPDGGLAGWYLPDAKVGVDLRETG
jgi:ketosteroid isomerase-like protein